MYSTRAFAELTGVTLKALRHYERMGLLGPMRTRARYRRYAFADLQQIERILALKSLGLSLTSIKLVLKRGPVGLEAHRALLEDRRARLNRAIAALHEIQRDADPRAALHGFMADAAWDRWEARRQQVAVPRPPDRAPASRSPCFTTSQTSSTRAISNGRRRRSSRAAARRSHPKRGRPGAAGQPGPPASGDTSRPAMRWIGRSGNGSSGSSIERYEAPR